MLIIPYGDTAILLKAGDDISLETNALVRKMLCLLDKLSLNGVTDLVPSYNELLIHFDPTCLSYHDLLEKLNMLDKDMEKVALPDGKLVEVAVVYGGHSGPDLEEVARSSGLSEKEVISIHCGVDYHVYMLGFTPGFCYLGGMDLRIAAPRKENPRVRVAAGSVGIAGQQTGIYPIDSPGGWQIIGKTDLKLFNPDREPVFLVNPGDKLRFVPVG